MMIAVNKSHLDAPSRNGGKTQSPPSQYGCLTPSPPTSPNQINCSLYNRNENESDPKSLNLTNRSFEAEQNDDEISSSRQASPKVERGKRFHSKIFIS